MQVRCIENEISINATQAFWYVYMRKVKQIQPVSSYISFLSIDVQIPHIRQTTENVD